MGIEIVIVGAVILSVIVFQICSFWKNKKKMKEYSTIFAGRDWSLNTDSQTGQVIGINGKGNSTFNAIKGAINKYLKSNAGGIIDYALLREAVDRNCDSLEEEISAQTPVPLYWGLCGTMGGVIIGLGSLLLSGAITKLVGGAAAGTSAAQGVNSLLIGVAFAMCASVCGIILTICNTIVFKNSKQQEESGKNAFLSWMQAYLLPVLPTNISNALTEMSRNLNRFNETFSKKVVQLDGTLSKVNEVYRGQQDVISKVCQMDPMRMAEANVKTLSELENCLAKFPIFSDQVEKFSQYLVKIDEFTEKLNKEIYRLDILEGINASMKEIKEFYERHKAEIKLDTALSQKTLDEALEELRTVLRKSVGELQNVLTAQTSELSNVINEEKNIVVNIAQDMKIKFINEVDTMKKQAQKLLNDMQDEFQEQLDKLPIQEELRQISSIPAKIDETTRRMENTNTTLISGVKICIEGMTSSIDKLNKSLSQITTEIKNGNEKIESELKRISAKGEEGHGVGRPPQGDKGTGGGNVQILQTKMNNGDGIRNIEGDQTILQEPKTSNVKDQRSNNDGDGTNTDITPSKPTQKEPVDIITIQSPIPGTDSNPQPEPKEKIGLLEKMKRKFIKKESK